MSVWLLEWIGLVAGEHVCISILLGLDGKERAFNKTSTASPMSLPSNQHTMPLSPTSIRFIHFL